MEPEKSNTIDALVLQTVEMLEAAGLTVNEVGSYLNRLSKAIDEARLSCFKPVPFRALQNKSAEAACSD